MTHRNGLTAPLRGDRVTLAYGDKHIITDLDIDIAPGEITAIVGPNACGKSTLLRGLARLLRPRSGAILLDGQAIHTIPTRSLATRVGLLPQGSTAPDGITVIDLVARGRYPHHHMFRRWNHDDDVAVAAAMTATSVTDLALRSVDELSGGQRQRAWIALTLAQDTEIILLDEPTTYLDLAHQVEILELLAELNATTGRTIVTVLHDLNLAARYSHQLIVMQTGTIVAQGAPNELITPDLISTVFGVGCRLIPDPDSDIPFIAPRIVPLHLADPTRTERNQTT